MKWWHKLILIFTILNLILLIGAYMAMYISPESFWPVAFIGLGYIPVLVVYLFFMVIWFFIRKKVFYVLLVFLLLGFNAHRSYLAIGSIKKTDTEGKKTYAILQYNVQGFDAYNKDGKYLNREEIIANIAEAKADIICLNSTIYADLLIENDTIRVFCSHLQSTQLNHYDLDFIEASNDAQTDFDADRITNKLKMSYALRAQEADSVSIYLKKSPHPIISCGDFNDTPVSYTYRKMSENLQDAFLQKGFGIGATYAPFPFIRIDYQLFDEDKFEIVDFKRIKERSSDHYPCVTTFVVND